MEGNPNQRQTIQTDIDWSDLLDSYKSEYKEEFIEKIEENYSGYPTVIQNRVIDIFIDHQKQDRLEAYFIQAPGGSGKTLAFSIPAVMIAIKNYKEGQQVVKFEEKKIKNKSYQAYKYSPQIIVLCDTKTLQEQLGQEIKRCIPKSFEKKIRITQISTGQTKQEQFGDFGEILIITPQLLDTLLNSKQDNIFLDQCKLLVVDEAEHTYSQSKEYFQNILNQLIKHKQVSIISASATLTEEYKQFVSGLFYGGDKSKTGISFKQELTLEGVTQFSVECPKKEFRQITRWIFDEIVELLDTLINQKQSDSQVIIFFNEIKLIDEFNEYLLQSKIGSGDKKILFNVIHSKLVVEKDNKVDKVENNKLIRKTFNSFRNHEFKVLLTTDIMARGIDINKVGLVINVFPPREIVPNQAEARINAPTYVHRIARTGRHKQRGIALTYFRDDGKYQIPDNQIEKALQEKFSQFKEPINILKDTENYIQQIVEKTVEAVKYNTDMLEQEK